MIEKFTDYLRDIGITTAPFLERIESILEKAKIICNEEITDILISNFVKKDNTIDYLGLGVYFSNYLFVAEEFFYKDKFWIHPLKMNIDYINFEISNYDFKQANEQSRLHIIISINGKELIEGRAFSKNCDHLYRIVEKYYMSNIIKE